MLVVLLTQLLARHHLHASNNALALAHQTAWAALASQDQASGSSHYRTGAEADEEVAHTHGAQSSELGVEADARTQLYQSGGGLPPLDTSISGNGP
jgi:hypothetical protein